MNIVKGVADLIRRSSSVQSGDSGSSSHAERSSLPAPRIRFSEVGDEAILYTLWERYEKESDMEEKRKLFHVFLRQFLIVFKNWEPIDSWALSKDTLLTDQPKEELSYTDDTSVGCSIGHPAEVISALTQETARLTVFIAESSGNDTRSTTDLLKPQSTTDLLKPSPFLNVTSEGISALDALTIVTRSMHGCRVFGFYGGIQKLTALMKGAIVQLKAISGVLDVEKSSSSISLDKVKLLQKILLSAVSIICNFMDPNSNTHKRMEFSGHSYSPGRLSVFHPSNVEAPMSDVALHWHQKAVVSVMEAGGLNWLVELLRVIRRLSMKEQWTDVILQSLTLKALQSALSENPRGQNHFKSIGGLEVLLDGLGISMNNARKMESISTIDQYGDENPMLELFQLHILYFEVLREAVFGNFSNLQFLCENGRVDKFANSFCSLGFIFHEYRQRANVLTNEVNIQMDFDIQKKDQMDSNTTKSSVSLPPKGFYPDMWNNYVMELSEILCSFLIDPQDSTTHNVKAPFPQSTLSISPLYGELSVKWLLRVLPMVFPCIKACSDHNELPSHIRVFINTLQHYALNSLRKVFVSSFALLNTLRNEGMWDLLFSENFFYFEAASDGESRVYEEIHSSPDGTSSFKKASSMEVLQIEVISFVELAATSDGSAHNVPEISILLDALEQSACNPELAYILAKTLLCILQLSTEKTLASFKTVQAIPRILKVVCIQAQESKKLTVIGSSPGRSGTEEFSDHAFERPSLFDMSLSWHKCMEMAMELFTQFLSAAHDAKIVILSSMACIDSLFELFWEEKLRSRVLNHVLDLMKIFPSSVADQKAKMYLCSKYLETFAHIREREKSYADLCIDLLVGMRDLIQWDPMYFQDLFRDGECFLHVVSLLNGNLEMVKGEELVINVLHTLTCLLGSNDTSKEAFRALVGNGYRTLQSLLLDYCQWHPGEGLLNALLDMLVDGKFDIKANPIIKNEDVIILYVSVLQKSSESLCHHGLNLFQQLLRDSISNRASCVSAGMLSFLLDWFSEEESDNVIMKIAQLIQVIGGHSISGKDIRKIFALLRSDKVGARQQYYSLLLTTVLAMLNEKGPTAFFDLSGSDSGIKMKTPLLWPVNKGFSFSCWLRVESFPRGGAMSLFSFLTENGRGCFALLLQDKLIYETINLKRQSLQLPINLVRKRWHFLCITHSIGRAFSGGSLLKCYLDGNLVSSDRCRYAKVNELLTNCSIGAKISLPIYEEDGPQELKKSSPFHGQIGPVYVFNDALSSELVQGIYLLGPSYMYSFLDREAGPLNDSHMTSGILDAKDSLASKILLGLNAQASDGRKLFNASAMLDPAVDKKLFEASIMIGTQLCSRRLLQQIIYCVGGVSVFFPLIAESDKYEFAESGQSVQTLLTPITRERLTAEVIELIASVLDENLANQQQMHLLSGFSILGFLLQSVPPDQLNLETLSSLKHLFSVVANCGLADLLVKEAISSIFLNPLIWVYTTYRVQRELYMFLVQQFDNDPRLLTSLCPLPHVIDIIRQYYWDVKSRFSLGGKPLLHPVTKEVIGERPNQDEIRKIRLLLLSLGEMSLRQNIAAADIKALVTFFDTSQDMTCIEDVLHMIIRAMSQKPLLASFLDQVNMIGGCHIFVNLLQREYEPIRLLSLQFLGRLLVGLPSEKKGSRFFNLGVGKSRSISESHRNIGIRMQPIFAAIADRLFKFPQTENLCASLFDVLLGGASPKQVLQRQCQSLKQRSKECNSHFFLPQMLILIFRFLSGCEDTLTRLKILRDLNDLLDSNPLNIESFMDYGWTSWLMASAKLDVLKNYREDPLKKVNEETTERSLARNLFCIVLGHHIQSVKGGWQHLEETMNFILMHCGPDGISYQYLLRDIFEDLVQRLVNSSSEENIVILQPCRDNTLFLLRLLDEMLIAELDDKLPFPASSSDFSLVSLDLDSHKEFNNALQEVLHGETNQESLSSRSPSDAKQPPGNIETLMEDRWWNLYDNLWILIGEINGKGPSKTLPRSSLSGGPSLGQRARGLVESLNIPAAEMAAAVVSGGIGTALGGKNSKSVDKAMLLRGERCPRIIFRLVILYLCKSSLERASRCAQQFISLLPILLVADDEQSRTRLQLFIWALLSVRSRFGMLDDGARFHVISHLIRETVNCGKSMLAASIASRDDSLESGSNSKESSTIHNLIQKDRVLIAVADEAKYMKSLKTDRDRQLHGLTARVDETASAESISSKAFEDEIQDLLSTIIASDDNRKAAFQLSHEEQQQNVTEKWMHLFRSLIDERGPWSANPFPNSSVRHWKLDKTEDRWRRRQKLRQNYHFDDRLCYPPSTTTSDESVSLNEAKSGFVGQIPEQMKRFLLKGVHKITDEASTELNEDENESIGQKVSLSEDPMDGQCAPVVKDGGDHKDNLRERLDSSPEKDINEVLMSATCVLVTPKRKLAGHLAVMKTALHFFGEFIVEGTGGSSVFKNFQVSSIPDSSRPDEKQKLTKWPVHSDQESDKIIPVDSLEVVNESLHQNKLKNIKRHRRWNIGKVKAVHWTRYLLRYTAAEIFFSDSTSPVFFNFASQKEAKEMGTLIVSTRNEYLFPRGSKDKNGIISFVDRRVALEMAETARERWRRREMTNFEYLMILNTLAGRSYNDLTQYPVFPWVLSDYSSEILDFNKSSTFRDLSKPVGALDSKRFEVFEDRYRNFCDPDIPNFYYGSHYSSMGIVLYYLLRLEPFTALHRNLQGGKFDHADRLFQSVEGTYRNCLSNTSDVKELIPEFFYMPEFLANANSYHLGVRQDGEPIGDVCLPPWAKGSPEEFVHKNREALESEYVSSNLHHWIDLVFGYKQRGKPAVEAANVFYYLTYEGAVDLDSMEDDLQRSAIEDQIANFGQTPIQIFRKKHPRRGPPIPIAHPLYFAPSSINLTSVVSVSSHSPSAILYVGLLDSSIVLVNQGLTLSVKTWLTTQLHSGGNFTFSGSQEPFFGIGSDILSPRSIGSPLAEDFGGQYFATLQAPNENFLISCGNWENSFKIISLNDGRMVQSVRQHKDVVNCVAVTSDGSILATGSYDTTVMVWEVYRGRVMEKRIRSSQEFSRKDHIVEETPFHILCGHDDIITCLYVSVELDIVISGSKDGTCIFHTLREGRYVRSIRHPSGSPLSKLLVSRHGRIVFYADNDLSLHLYSINGKHLVSCESNGRLNCIELSSCEEFLVCGGDQGLIVVRSMSSLEIVQRYSGVGKIITSLMVTPEECFLAGTRDGSLLVYSIENPQLRKATLLHKARSKSSSTG